MSPRPWERRMTQSDHGGVLSRHTWPRSKVLVSVLFFHVLILNKIDASAEENNWKIHKFSICLSVPQNLKIESILWKTVSFCPLRIQCLWHIDSGWFSILCLHFWYLVFDTKCVMSSRHQTFPQFSGTTGCPTVRFTSDQPPEVSKLGRSRDPLPGSVVH